jgi:hypothetical protein
MLRQLVKTVPATMLFEVFLLALIIYGHMRGFIITDEMRCICKKAIAINFTVRFLEEQRKLTNILSFGVGVLLAADSQSTSKSGYRASLWDP